MEITHLPEDNLFKTVVDGYTAYVTYIIRDGKLDIRHTIVPPSSLSPLAPMLSFGCKGIRNITATPEKITEDAAVVLCNRK